MKAATQEWVDKAKADWLATGQLIRVRKSPNYDLICFEAQQSAEKYLKARLIEAGIVFPKTHDLLALLGLVLPVELSWNTLQKALLALDPYSVLIRYPGFSANRDEAKDARKHCAVVRATVRFSLGLPI